MEEAIGGTSEMNLGEDEDEEFEDSAVSQSSKHKTNYSKIKPYMLKICCRFS